MSIKSLVIIGSLALSCAGADQTGTSIGGPKLGGPKLGYALDPAVHALRPILGIAGASTLGEPLDTGFAIEEAAPDGELGYALAIDRASHGVWLIRPDQPVVATRVPVAGEAAAVYLSPQGTAAALVMRDGRINLVSGLETASFVITGLLSGRRLDRRPVALAVSDDGNFVVAAYEDAQPVLLGRDGTRLTLTVPGQTSRLAFRPSSSDVLSAGPDNRVWLIQRTSSDPAVRQIAGPENGISTPGAVAFTSDGNSALVANSGNGAVVALDLASGAASSIACGCTPTRFARLASRGLFRLNDLSDQPIYLFDSDAGRALFVPPLRSNTLHANQLAGQQN